MHIPQGISSKLEKIRYFMAAWYWQVVCANLKPYNNNQFRDHDVQWWAIIEKLKLGFHLGCPWLWIKRFVWIPKIKLIGDSRSRFLFMVTPEVCKSCSGPQDVLQEERTSTTLHPVPQTFCKAWLQVGEMRTAYLLLPFSHQLLFLSFLLFFDFFSLPTQTLELQIHFYDIWR